MPLSIRATFFIGALFVLYAGYPMHSFAAPVIARPILNATSTCIDGISRVTLSWTNPGSATSFTLHRNPTLTGAKAWAAYVNNQIALTYTDTRVSVGTYQYQVQAFQKTGSSRYSEVVSVTIPTCTVKPPPPTIRPTLTGSVQCVSGVPQIQLNWNNPSSSESFTLHRNPTLGGSASWASIVSGVTTYNYLDTRVASSVSYQYQIQAISGTGSLYSNIFSTTTPLCTMTPIQTTVPKNYKWGAYAGWSNFDMAEFETKVGENPHHMASFVHWGNANTFPTYMSPFTKDKGRTLIIFWEPSDHTISSTIQPAFTMDAILAGNWDVYIRSFAEQARTYGAPVILIPLSEMNGNWNSWSGTTNGNTPEKVVAAFRHIRTVFGSVPNVKFGWAPNSSSVPDTTANSIGNYYPGSAYVDIVGVDGFNFGDPWYTFDQIFSKPLTLLSNYGKPIYIFSFASAPGTQKSAWITDALTTQMQKYPLIEGWTWFNQNKERDWRVWSDSTSLNAFKNAIP